MSDEYSQHLSTVYSRRCYHNKTKAAKRKLFKKQEKIKLAKVANGKCYQCGKKRERPEIRMCNKCHKAQAERTKQYAIDNALEGKCCKCSNQAKDNCSHCEECLAKARRYAAARRSKSGTKTT